MNMIPAKEVGNNNIIVGNPRWADISSITKLITSEFTITLTWYDACRNYRYSVIE